MKAKTNVRKPKWLKANTLGSVTTQRITKYLRKYNLNTVCEEAKCPNRGECFERGTATFMILGSVCTRNCAFCAVKKAQNILPKPDPDEPEKIALLTKKLKLKHVVITTVTRDDLTDGGAGQFVKVIEKLRDLSNQDLTVEVLISDLKGNWEALTKIINAKPDVLNHNVETIARLYPQVRAMADFNRSLDLLRLAKQNNSKLLTKSGFMVGLGEKYSEVISLLKKLREVGVNFVTIGQYLQPDKNHFPVKKFITPEIFEKYKEEAFRIGFEMVESGPLVRSSYKAEKVKKII